MSDSNKVGKTETVHACTYCSKRYKRHTALATHSLRVHGWIHSEDRMATEEEKRDMLEKQQQSKERRGQKASKKDDVIIVSGSDHDSDYWVIQDEFDEVTESGGYPTYVCI